MALFLPQIIRDFLEYARQTSTLSASTRRLIPPKAESGKSWQPLPAIVDAHSLKQNSYMELVNERPEAFILIAGWCILSAYIFLTNRVMII